MLFEWRVKKRAKKRRAGEVRQGMLLAKNGLAGEDVIVVEKSNMAKFLIRTCGAVIRTMAALGVTGLAFTGLAALVFPGPRMEMVLVFQEVIRQLKVFLM